MDQNQAGMRFAFGVARNNPPELFVGFTGGHVAGNYSTLIPMWNGPGRAPRNPAIYEDRVEAGEAVKEINARGGDARVVELIVREVS